MMTKQPPDNLGTRQYELNKRINEAFTKTVNFEDLKHEKENNEIEKFFKIDLAAKCRNVDYIIDVLKTGNTLYAHRVLKKCPWIFDDEYSNIINPQHLEEHILPKTSLRVQRMILKNVAINVRTVARAEAFYNYYEKKITDIALKCLPFTSEEFKLDLLQKQNSNIQRKKFSYIRYLIGKSFALLEAYMKTLTDNQEKTILKFRYMYPVNNVKYLELLEKYVQVPDHYKNHWYDESRFDNKLSDDIVKKYKDRLLAKPLFYLNNIKKRTIIRNITPDDAKIIIIAILPSSAQEFWDSWFRYHQAKDFLDLVPHSEIMGFLKKIFNNKYPNDEFETHWAFYKQEYYIFMTVEEQEQWALNHIKSEKQILGVGKDFLWYAFINFKEAFDEMKKLLIVTKEPELRRLMLITLAKIKRNNRELETLFKYYNKRHTNEPILHKINFFDNVIHNQNVYEFDESCWEAFYSLLLSLELYNNQENNPSITYPLEHYKTVALFYHILHAKEMSENLMSFFLDEFVARYTDVYGDATMKHHFNKLDEHKQQFLYNYLYTFYTNKINEYKNELFNRRGHHQAERYFKVILSLIHACKLYQDKYKRDSVPQKRKTRTINADISDRQLLRELKKDKNLTVDKQSELKARFINNNPLKINNFLKKIKIYFKSDLTENYLAMFGDLVSGELGTKSVDACVNAIFELGDESMKVNFMQKYVPENAKIDFNNLDAQHLSTQRAICRYASNSIPPVPLENVLAYMKGDYVRHCLHLFSVYMVGLPMSVSIELAKAVLNSPVSIQKHALRLAFHCFSPDYLKNMSNDIWNKTKNVSIRSVIYKGLFNRIVAKNESALYDTLISFTLDLHDDDEKVLFTLVTNDNLPKDILGEYRKAAWKAVREFKDKEPNIGRKADLIYDMRWNLEYMDKEFVRKIIDEHLNTMFSENKLELTYSDENIAALYKEKWDLTVEYIIANCCEEELLEYMCIAEQIVSKCLNNWNGKSCGNYIYQRCCWEFVQNLNAKSMEYYTTAEKLIPIYERILDLLQQTLPVHEMYLPKWEMQLVFANRLVMKKHRMNFEKDNKSEVVTESLVYFGKEVGKLVLEYVDRKMYFSSVVEKVKSFILKRVDELLTVIFAGAGDDFKMYKNSAIVSLAYGLLEFETVETNLLALELLPPDITDSDEYTRKSYQSYIETVMKFPHPEVQFSAQQKLLITNN